MVDWMNDLILPILKLSFMSGAIGFGCFIVGKALYNWWSKSFKFVWKYKIRKQKYPQETMEWLSDALEKQKDWYDVKKILIINSVPIPVMNEMLWIYEKILIDFNNEKGGKNKNGRNNKRSIGKNESRKNLPKF
jgi:hypothetical protein